MSPRDYFRGKSVLITGASSGIGEELAIQLGQAAAKLTLAARRMDLLSTLAQRIALAGAPAPLTAECDVTQDGALENAVAMAVKQWGHLDIAIANAGFGVVGPFSTLSLEDFRRQFETNVFGVLRTLYAALPQVRRNQGNLVIIGSVAGWASTPGAAPYAMSKFALRALADSIGPELARNGVRVTLISPGFVESDIRRVDNRGKFHANAKEPMPAWLVMNREQAGRQILSAIARGQREAIVTSHGKVLVALARFTPSILRAFTRRMAARSRGYRDQSKSA
jgi:short-subunit dehydrogenase